MRVVAPMTPRRLLAFLPVLLALVLAAPASAAERIVRFDPQATSAAGLTTKLDALGLESAALRRLPLCKLEPAPMLSP